jgi:hypothetical protein
MSLHPPPGFARREFTWLITLEVNEIKNTESFRNAGGKAARNIFYESFCFARDENVVKE